MKTFLRSLFVGLFLLFAWPFFLYKKYGNRTWRQSGAVILVANHYSNFDPFFLWMIFRKNHPVFVTAADVKKRRIPYLITRLFDCLYVDYSSNNIGFFKDCLRVLNGGGMLCIFPEGGINPRKAGFIDFKHSFLFFARKTDCDILPVYLYPELSVFKRSSVYIGDPVTKADYDKLPDNLDAAAFVQSRIMDYSFEVPNARDIRTLEEFDRLLK